MRTDKDKMHRTCKGEWTCQNFSFNHHVGKVTVTARMCNICNLYAGNVMCCDIWGVLLMEQAWETVSEPRHGPMGLRWGSLTVQSKNAVKPHITKSISDNKNRAEGLSHSVAYAYTDV